MKKFSIILLLLVICIPVLSCLNNKSSDGGKPTIVVTYSVLGSVVKELVGEQATVVVSIPNGLDPHEWEPSAKDIETINKADLVIQNGLGLESGLEKTLQKAKDNGVKFLTATDYITLRYVGPGEGIPSGDPDQIIGTPDPHFWMDPTAMKSVVSALATVLRQDLNLGVTELALNLEIRLDTLDKEIAEMIASLSPDNRKLVTGHESMGYFAQRYNLKLVGVIIPSLSTQAEISAADLAALKKAIEDNQVKVIFTELGTSMAVANTIGNETGVKVVELSTHILPDDGSYFTFLLNVANTVNKALR